MMSKTKVVKILIYSDGSVEKVVRLASGDFALVLYPVVKR